MLEGEGKESIKSILQSKNGKKSVSNMKSSDS